MDLYSSSCKMHKNEFWSIPSFLLTARKQGTEGPGTGRVLNQLRLYWDNEKKMETAIMDYIGFRV